MWCVIVASPLLKEGFVILGFWRKRWNLGKIRDKGGGRNLGMPIFKGGFRDFKEFLHYL